MTVWKSAHTCSPELHGELVSLPTTYDSARCSRANREPADRPGCRRRRQGRLARVRSLLSFDATMKVTFVFLLCYSFAVLLVQAVFASDAATERWNQTWEKLNALQDDQVRAFLHSSDADENKVAGLILTDRQTRLDWETFRNQLKGASFERLVGRLDSSNSTEVAVVLLELQLEHKGRLQAVVPLLVDLANKEHTRHVPVILQGIERITGADFHARYDGPTNAQLLNRLNIWWREHRREFEGGEPSAPANEAAPRR